VSVIKSGQFEEVDGEAVVVGLDGGRAEQFEADGFAALRAARKALSTEQGDLVRETVLAMMNSVDPAFRYFLARSVHRLLRCHVR
jgi:hypothetical protein